VRAVRVSRAFTPRAARRRPVVARTPPTVAAAAAPPTVAPLHRRSLRRCSVCSLAPRLPPHTVTPRLLCVQRPASSVQRSSLAKETKREKTRKKHRYSSTSLLKNILVSRIQEVYNANIDWRARRTLNTATLIDAMRCDARRKGRRGAAFLLFAQ